jgi:6,7-dimethyl-8-ribityllumazine synthase
MKNRRKPVSGRMDAKGKRIGIVVSRWNELVTKELLSGALDELDRHGAEEPEIVQVPGTWEIPVAAKAMIGRAGDDRPHALVALGCILQGATSHAQLLAADVGAALMNLQTQTGIPIAWGILTPESQADALERAGMKMGNKGREAALAAIEMASLVQRLGAK